MKKRIILATRRSALALRQSHLVAEHLRRHWPKANVSLLELVTAGDRRQEWSLEKEGGKGLFTGELEMALQRGEADIAVHSSKDLPTTLPEGLVLAGFLPRERPNDVLVLREGCGTPRVLATGSPRRRAQGSRLFPEAEWIEFRGNVETRLRKIAEGEADGTLLAAAGLRRLGIESWPGLVFRQLTVEEMVPAPGQGAIALESPAAAAGEWSPLLDAETGVAVRAERAFLAALGGGCHAAFAAHYAEGYLSIFHERTGYRRVPVQTGEGESVETAVRRIVVELGLTEGTGL